MACGVDDGGGVLGGSGKLTVHQRPPLVIMKPAVMASALAGVAVARAAMVAITVAARAVSIRRIVSTAVFLACTARIPRRWGGVGQDLER